MTDLPNTADAIESIDHYFGGGKCQYSCDNMAEFVVVARTGASTVTVAACKRCLNKARIWPHVNGWVDERTDKVDTA